jgi:nanoRNase/pAp phosphatase (c-di-AMP/oligoRNAs hydrolase)
MKQLIANSLNILVIPKPEPDLDNLAAAFALSLSLKQMGKKVTMYISPNIYTETVKKKFPPQNMRFLSKDEPGTIVLTLDNIDAGIKEVKWKEEEGKVNIFITTDKGDINKEKIKINEIKSSFDLTILVGLENPAELKEFYNNHRYYFKEEGTVVVSKTKNGSPFNQVIIDEDSSAHGMFRIMLEQGMVLSSNVATNLLAGIYWKTNNFTDTLPKEMFAVADRLVQLGADQEHAKNIANETVSFANTLYFADVYGNIKTAGNGVFYAIVPESKLEQNGKKDLIFREFVPLAQLIGCKIAFVIVHGEAKNTVYIRSNSAEHNLIPIWDKYKGEGNKVNGSFSTMTPIGGLEELMLQETRNILKAKKPVSAPITPAQIPQPIPQPLAKPQPVMQPGPVQPLRQPEPELKPFISFNPPDMTPRGDRPIPVSAPTPESKPVEPYKEQPQTGPAMPPDDLIKPTMSGGDPLAAAQQLPEPLHLEDESAQLMPPAPMSPLPPASI